MCVLSRFNHVPLFVTLWTVAKTPLSMQEAARMLEQVAVESSENLPNPGVQPASLMSPALAGRFFTTSAIWEAPISRKTA